MVNEGAESPLFHLRVIAMRTEIQQMLHSRFPGYEADAMGEKLLAVVCDIILCRLDTCCPLRVIYIRGLSLAIHVSQLLTPNILQ